MKLTDYHSSRTVCSPTRAGLLTGRYQQRAGIEAVIHSGAGVPSPQGQPLDGVDLSRLILDGKELPDRSLFWASLSHRGSRSEAMRDRPWKLVVQHSKAKPGSFENERVELYRLDRDPAEQVNLANNEPDQTATMHARLKDWYAELQRTAADQPGG